MTTQPTLEDLRTSIDSIDTALCALYAERFRITEKIGHYKAAHHMPAVDAAREQQQLKAFLVHAKQQGLNEAIAEKLLRLTIAEVVRRHSEIMEDGNKTSK